MPCLYNKQNLNLENLNLLATKKGSVDGAKVPKAASFFTARVQKMAIKIISEMI